MYEPRALTPSGWKLSYDRTKFNRGKLDRCGRMVGNLTLAAGYHRVRNYDGAGLEHELFFFANWRLRVLRLRA